MLRDRIRRGVRSVPSLALRAGKRVARRILGDREDPSASDAMVAPASVSAPAASPAGAMRDEPASEPARTSPFAGGDPAEPTPMEALDDTSGPPLTREAVEVLFADMVRPALQADGGDIDLVRVQDGEVHVRLIGACRSCPSSTITMKMGIERLLAEEFPQFRSLVQVDAPNHHSADGAADLDPGL